MIARGDLGVEVPSRDRDDATRSSSRKRTWRASRSSRAQMLGPWFPAAADARRGTDVANAILEGPTDVMRRPSRRWASTQRRRSACWRASPPRPRPAAGGPSGDPAAPLSRAPPTSAAEAIAAASNTRSTRPVCRRVCTDAQRRHGAHDARFKPAVWTWRSAPTRWSVRPCKFSYGVEGSPWCRERTTGVVCPRLAAPDEVPGPIACWWRARRSGIRGELPYRVPVPR